MKSPTKTELAKSLGCSRSTLHTWEAAGCPTNNIDAAILWVSMNGVGGGGDVQAPPDLKRKIAEKRLAILEQQRIAAVRDNQERNGELVATAEVAQKVSAAGSSVMAELERRDREMPARLAGLSAIEIAKIMSRDTEAIRKTLKEKFEAIGTK